MNSSSFALPLLKSPSRVCWKDILFVWISSVLARKQEVVESGNGDVLSYQYRDCTDRTQNCA